MSYITYLAGTIVFIGAAGFILLKAYKDGYNDGFENGWDLCARFRDVLKYHETHPSKKKTDERSTG